MLHESTPAAADNTLHLVEVDETCDTVMSKNMLDVELECNSVCSSVSSLESTDNSWVADLNDSFWSMGGVDYRAWSNNLPHPPRKHAKNIALEHGGDAVHQRGSFVEVLNDIVQIKQIRDHHQAQQQQQQQQPQPLQQSFSSSMDYASPNLAEYHRMVNATFRPHRRRGPTPSATTSSTATDVATVVDDEKTTPETKAPPGNSDHVALRKSDQSSHHHHHHQAPKSCSSSSSSDKEEDGCHKARTVRTTQQTEFLHNLEEYQRLVAISLRPNRRSPPRPAIASSTTTTTTTSPTTHAQQQSPPVFTNALAAATTTTSHPNHNPNIVRRLMKNMKLRTRTPTKGVQQQC